MKFRTRGPRPDTRHPKSETRNSRPETRNPKPESNEETGILRPTHQSPNNKHQTPNTKHQTPNTSLGNLTATHESLITRHGHPCPHTSTRITPPLCPMVRCRAKSARIRQSRPDYGLDLSHWFKHKSSEPLKLLPLRSEAVGC